MTENKIEKLSRAEIDEMLVLIRRKLVTLHENTDEDRDCLAVLTIQLHNRATALDNAELSKNTPAVKELIDLFKSQSKNLKDILQRAKDSVAIMNQMASAVTTFGKLVGVLTKQ